eukprot:7631985-Pyramimonas_sp.AAC.1
MSLAFASETLACESSKAVRRERGNAWPCHCNESRRRRGKMRWRCMRGVAPCSPSLGVVYVVAP